ncbi:tape measure protein [Corynebacterium marquesiae]|uniref:tape measure protein n=1 Tax=Corynebacterium marquesiae TaxID=2913503 RepID=UPI00254ABD3D|nr:tape measure protein [Corynebacterium marquesiae]MDK8668983.1 tape measure protein [Corynebacterium marquesiae]
MAGVELANAWVNIIPNTSKIAPQIKSAFGEVDKISADAGKRMGAAIDGGFGAKVKSTVGKLGGLAVGLAGVSSAAQVMQNGFAKVTSIEDTTQALGVMMGSADKAAGFMDKLVESNMKSTYSFDAWAEAGKTLVAFGVDADQANESVTALGEAAAATGKGEEALLSMSDAFGQAAASGKISMDTINRLSAGGVQGLTILANEYGVTTEEMQKMISSGAVPAQEGIKALTDGIINGSDGAAGKVEKLSGVMGKMAETTSGTLKNMGAELTNAAAAVFEKISPGIKFVADKIRVGAQDVTKWIQGIDLSALGEQMAPTLQTLGDAFKDLGPAVGSLAGSFGTVVSNISVSTWTALAGALNALAPLITTVLVPLVEQVANIAAQNPGAVQAIVTAFLGFKAVSSIAGPVGTAVTSIKNLGGAAKFAHTAFKGASLGEGMLNIMAGAKSANPVVAKMGTSMAGAGAKMAKGSMAASGVGKAFSMIGRAAMTAIRFINPWVAGFTLVTSALTLFFTKTETGRALWESFTQALGAGWDWIVEKFQAGIEWITTTFGPVFSQIGETLSGVWDSVVSGVTGAFTRIKEVFVGAFEFLQTGDTADYAAALGLGEDSPIFTALTFLRDKFVEVKDFAIEAWGQMQENWETFTTGFGQFYETWIVPVIVFFQTALQTLQEIASVVFDALVVAWEALGTAFSFVWENVINPVFEFFQNLVMAWWTIVTTAFTAVAEIVNTVLVGAFNVLSAAISAAWNGVIKPVFYTFKQVAEIIFPAIANIVRTVVGTAFRIMGDVISSTWNNVIRPAWNVMRTVFGIVADVLTGNFSNLGNRFSELGQRISNLVHGLFTNSFNLLKSVVTNSLNAAKAVIGIFKQAVISMVNISKEKINSLVAGFQAMPGKIKAAFAGAGTWLLDAGKSIIRGLADGVRAAAGMVEDAVRAVIPDNLERFVPGLHLGGVVPAFARGGVLPNVPGFTRNDRDPILGWSKEKKQPIARVEPGEFIVNRDATKKYGRLLAAINGGKFDGTKGDFGLPGYAKGGVVTYDQAYRFLRGESINGSRQPGSLEGSPYVWGGGLNANWGDCSGTQSAIASLVAGVGTSGRKFATGTQGGWLAQNGFRRGRGPGKNAFETAYFNGGPYGGHTAGTLFDSKGRSLNVEMGGGRGNGQIGGPAAGSRHSQFTDVWWHPLKSAAGQALSDGKVVGTSTKGVTVDAGEGNKFQAETIDWGEASQYGTDWEKENKRNKNLRRWSAGIFDTGGILKPGNIAINASGKPERVLDPRLTVAVEKVAKVSPALAKSMENLANVNWSGVGTEIAVAFNGGDAGNKNLAAAVGDRVAERITGYSSFAGAQYRSIQKGNKVQSYLENIGLSEGLGLADQIGSLIGIDGIKSTFGGVVDAFEDMEDAAVAEVDASDAVKQAEKNLAKARKEGSPEDVKAAEEELTKARGAVQLAARATGQAQVAMMVELASLAINLVKGVFKFIEGKIQGVMQAHVDAFKAVGSAMESVGKLDAEVLKLRESVTGLFIDQAMAQIELAAAARNVRIAQMDGVTSQLQATKTLAEAQAAFDEQRQADMRLAAMGYDDLSLAYDRFRWGMLDANGDVMDQMAAWSDESHALYSELLAAQVNQQLVEKQAQQANLEAAYKHTLAVIELNDVTSSLEVAAKKLAVASGHAFGMDQVGATVGQRYSELMGEKATLKADQASLKTWLNPVNWFTTMPANQRRIKQIDQQLRQLQAMPEFQDFDRGTRRDIDRAVKSAGWMGFFGAGDKVDEMIKNSALGDASRALDQMEFENRLIDLKAEQDTLRRKVEKNLAEVEYRKQLDPLETLIAGLEQERESNKTWAEYWRTDNENIRKSLADLAGHQADYASELKRMSAEPNKVVQISGDTFSREQLEAAMAELGVRVERLERPRASASQVVASRR